MKMAEVSNLDRVPASLRMAWDMSRACRPDVRVTHLALDLGPRYQGSDGVDDHEVERAGPHEHVGDLERLFAGVGLGDEELVDVDAQLARVGGVERVLGVDEGRDAALALGLGDHVEGDRGLARTLGPEDLDDAPARDASDPQRDVERHGTGGDDADPGAHGVLAQLHDGALTELLLDLLERDVEHLVAVHRALLVDPCSSGGEVPVERRSLMERERYPVGSDITYTPVIHRIDPGDRSDPQHRNRTDVRPQAPQVMDRRFRSARGRIRAPRRPASRMPAHRRPWADGFASAPSRSR